MKKVLIYCDGGFGNRLNTLYAAFEFVESIGSEVEIEIVWPINQYCGAGFSSIFEDCKYKIHGYTQAEVSEIFPGALLISHEVQKFTLKLWCDINKIASRSQLIRMLDGRDICVFMTPLWPLCTSTKSIEKFKSEFSFKAIFVHDLNDSISRTKVGLHLRGTDYGFSDKYFNLIFFVVKIFFWIEFVLFTDDHDIRERFGTLKNISFSSKLPGSLPVRKYSNKDWSSSIDNDTHTTSYNIIRSEDSTIQGVFEMLLLASFRTKLITSRSTFLYNSFMLGSRGFGFFVFLYLNRFFSLIRLLKRQVL